MIAVIKLNINRLNNPIKRQTQIQKKESRDKNMIQIYAGYETHMIYSKTEIR